MNNNNDNFDNISFIQYLHRKVLEEAEEAMTLDLPGDDEEAPQENQPPTPAQARNAQRKRNILKRRMRMWFKNPLIWVFREIADTELRIDKQRPSAAKNSEKSVPLDEKDIALVKDFVRKQKPAPNPEV